jgi:hypothetical protein
MSLKKARNEALNTLYTAAKITLLGSKRGCMVKYKISMYYAIDEMGCG